MADASPRFADFFFTDCMGGLHMMEESINNVDEILKAGEWLRSPSGAGVGVDGSSSAGYASVDKSDIILRSLPADRRSLKIECECVDGYFCSVTTNTGAGHPSDPRHILQRVVDKAASMNLTCEMFSELEFYLLDKDGKPNDTGKYLDLPPKDGALRFRRELCHTFESSGLEVKRLHHEVGPGQHEPVLRNADDTVLGFWLTDMVARDFGWSTQFSPKPFPRLPGNGLHQHILLRKKDSGENAMVNAEGDLNDLALHFVGGMIRYARDICAVFARHVESFDRLKPGHEAPTLTTWGHASRNALVRVPTISTRDKVRVEFRAGDSSGSPHLLCATILAAGLKGIEESIAPPPEEIPGLYSMSPEELKKIGVFALPTSLQECKTVLQSSKFLEEVVGPSVLAVLIRDIDAKTAKH